MIFHLETTRHEILNLIENIPDHLFNERESESTWSIKQVLEHLYKTEVEITKAIKYMLTLPEREHLLDQPLALTLDRTHKISAPTAIVPTSRPGTKQDMLHLLSQSRKQLLQLVDSIPPEQDLTTRGMKHPVFNNLSLKQWIEFIGYHEKRHLAHILEIKQHITNRSV